MDSKMARLYTDTMFLNYIIAELKKWKFVYPPFIVGKRKRPTDKEDTLLKAKARSDRRN